MFSHVFTCFHIQIALIRAHGNRIMRRMSSIQDEESSKQDEASSPSLNRRDFDLKVETEACNGNLDINDGSGDVEAKVDYSNSTLDYSNTTPTR